MSESIQDIRPRPPVSSSRRAGRPAAAGRDYPDLVQRAPSRERYPADALVKALIGRTISDATCDGEGMDDVRLLLDDGTAIPIHCELDADPESLTLAESLGRRAVAAPARLHWRSR